MVKSLYGHTMHNQLSDVTVDGQGAKEAMKDRLERRVEFSINFWGWLFYGVLMPSCCNCVKRCCSRSHNSKLRMAKYEKLNVALQRLSFEIDIQRMISLNRVSRVVHKDIYLARQRRGVNFSRKFVISDLDINPSRGKQRVVPDEIIATDTQ